MISSSSSSSNNSKKKMINDEITAPLLATNLSYNAEINMNDFEIIKKDHRFSTGLCGCCDDCKTFWFSFFCPCFQYGRNVSHFGHPPIFDSTDVGFNSFTYLFMECACCFGIVMSTVLRGDVRDKYGIKGNVFGDFFANIFCRPCSLAQIAREIKENENTEQDDDVCSKYPPPVEK